MSVPMVVVVGAGSAARRLCDECAGTTFSIFYAECTLPCETCGAHPRPCFCEMCRTPKART